MNTEFNKKFVRDLKLPIAVWEYPYFSYFLKLIDPYYNSVSHYEMFINSINNHGGELFFKNISELLHKSIDDIKSKKIYEEFNNFKLEQLKKEVKIESRELYHQDNDGKSFISIDLVKANFQSIHYLFPDFFDGANTYQDFVKNLGFNDYMVVSKQIRQVLFGNLNPQRQQKIQKYMMNKVAEFLIDSGVSVNNIYSLSSDELVFENTGYNLEKIKEQLNGTGFNLRVESFKLEKPFKQAMFVKKIDDGSFVFKMVPTSMMAEFIKKFEGRPLEDYDFHFYDENKRLSKYLKPYIEDK